MDCNLGILKRLASLFDPEGTADVRAAEAERLG
jgi:hypothetical protein